MSTTEIILAVIALLLLVIAVQQHIILRHMCFQRKLLLSVAKGMTLGLDWMQSMWLLLSKPHGNA